jgi:hypothetical protein
MGDLSLPVQQADSGNAVAMASVAMMMDSTKLSSLITFSKMMAESTISVPDHLRGKPSDCLAIAMQAAQWGMNPFQVAQKTHIVSGKLGYEAQLVNAIVQASGQIKGGFKYEFDGDGNDLKCRVGAVLRGESDVTWGEWLAIKDITTKNSPLWKTNPKQQLGYLQCKNWSRLYCPGAILGIYGDDELIDADVPLPGGTRQMGNVDEVPQRPQTVAELPVYEAAKFDANLPNWSKKIASGEKTVDELITWLQSKNRLTEGQIKRLRAVKVAEVVDTNTGEITKGQAAQGAQTTQTQAADDTEAHPLEVALNQAKTRDALDLLADRIESEAGSPDWEAYLKSVYHTNVERLDR